MPQVRSKRRLSAVSLAALLAVAPIHLVPLLAASPLSSPATAKEGGSQSGHGGGDSDSGGGGPGSGGGSDHSGPGHSGEEGDHDGGDDPATHDVRRAVSGFTVEVKTDGSDVEVIYPDGWKEEIHHGIFQLRDPAGRTVVERQATAADLARLNDLAR